MAFAAPFWLIGLLPWTAVTLWLLSGQRPRQVVPFLPLWQGEPLVTKPRRALQLTPIALAAALLAMLLAVLAAGRPRWEIGGTRGALTILVDHGMTMSARTPIGRRYAELAATIQPRVRAIMGPGVVQLIGVPGDSQQTD